MQLTENLMAEYERAIRNKDKTIKNYIKHFLAYSMCRSGKCFDEISDDEFKEYVNDLITSDVCCMEYSGVDESENTEHTKCMALFEDMNVI